ncbi:TPA: LicD family protein [Clostridium perfringens]|nr:LicD family protein [Clostridium perfringens]
MSKEVSNEQLKLIGIEILKYIDELCEKNSIDYFINFGTLIGAIRHQGFIPWDDDIDICMERSEYERFLKIIKEENKYRLINSSTQNYYYNNFSRICDKKTYLTFYNIPNIENMGVFVDVFPLDNIPQNINKKEEMFKKIYELSDEIYYSLPLKWYKTLGIKRKIKMYLYKIFNKNLNYFNLINQMDKIMKEYNGKTDILSCLCLPDDRMTFTKKEYSGRIRVKFENIEVNAPLNYDMILRKLYGDYMKMPREIEQISLHHFKVYWKE